MEISLTNYTCPKCNEIASDESFVSRGEIQFNEYPDPNYSWDEIHKCLKCDTLYLLNNGT